MKTHTLKFRAVDKDRFEEVRNGIKTIETRAGTKKYINIAVDDKIKFVCGKGSFSKKIAKKYHWPTIEAMLAEIDLKKVMPDLNSIDQVRERYASFPDYEKKIREFGILGLELE